MRNRQDGKNILTEKVLELKRDWVFGMDWKTISDPLNPNVNRFVCGIWVSMFNV